MRAFYPHKAANKLTMSANTGKMTGAPGTFVFTNAGLDRRFGNSEQQRAAAVAELNKLLATLTDLRAQAKQAHWNVRGAHFRSLHKLFDDVALSAADAFIDRVAERVAALDGYVRGALSEASAGSVLQPYAAEGYAWNAMKHTAHLHEQVARAAALAERVARAASRRGDEATNTLVGEVVEQLDKSRWMLRATLQKQSS